MASSYTARRWLSFGQRRSSGCAQNRSSASFYRRIVITCASARSLPFLLRGRCRKTGRKNRSDETCKFSRNQTNRPVKLRQRCTSAATAARKQHEMLVYKQMPIAVRTRVISLLNIPFLLGTAQGSQGEKVRCEFQCRAAVDVSAPSTT